MTDWYLTSEEKAEAMRKKYRYRQLILSGKLVLPYERAAQLLGPDCLYQLYASRESADPRREPAKSRSSKHQPIKRSKQDR